MKKLQTYIAFLVVLVLGTQLQAQTLSDALRMSDFEYLGTARSLGSGGPVFGGLGGDQGGILYNPATLATYARGEFMISPYLLSTQNRTSLGGSTYNGLGNEKIGAANLGFVFVNRPLRAKWKTSNLSIGYYKVADFNEQIIYDGQTPGSIVQRFQERANTKSSENLDLFEAGPAFSAGAIYDFDGDNLYDTDIIDGQEISKNQNISRRGYINELAINWAGNWDDKLSIGIGVGIPFYRYTESKTYNEQSPDNLTAFRSLEYGEYLETSGSGFNLKLGIIATPVKFIRIGAGMHTRTMFNLEDEYNTETVYSFDEGNGLQSFSGESPIGYFNYRYSSPFKAYGNIAFLLRSESVKGFIGANVKYANYTSGRFDLTRESNNPADAQLQEDLNFGINNQLSRALNYGVGGELAFDIFRVRGGVQFEESPYYVDEGQRFTRYHGGLGLRFDKVYLDFGVSYGSRSYGYSPYQLVEPSEQPVVSIDNTRTNMVLTFGYMFND